MFSRESKNNVPVKGHAPWRRFFKDLYDDSWGSLRFVDKISLILLMVAGVAVFRSFLCAAILFVFTAWLMVTCPGRVSGKGRNAMGGAGVVVCGVGVYLFAYARGIDYFRLRESGQAQGTFWDYLNAFPSARKVILTGCLLLLVGICLYLGSMKFNSLFVPGCMILSLPAWYVHERISYCRSGTAGSFAEFFRLPGNLLTFRLAGLYAIVGVLLLVMRLVLAGSEE
jgi:hypothetical protein